MIGWLHIGDLHLDADDGWQSLERLEAIVDEANWRIGDAIDFVYLPGDNANHGTPEQYARMLVALAPLNLPWRIIPGDHDFEPGDLAAYDAAIPLTNRPEAETIAGHRCLFLDIVSAGAGGPDFRVTMHHRNKLSEELARAAATGATPVVFMHAYPGDLAADGDAIARAFIDGGVAIVDTGHTHYNELLNDGRTIYAATRSTGQIEEDGGRAGYTLAFVDRGVVSWRFRRVDAAWPHVQITAPADRRLITRPGTVPICAKVFGNEGEPVWVSVDGGPRIALHAANRSVWQGEVSIDAPGLHRLSVTAGEARDTIEILVRDVDAIPKRRLPIVPGHDCHAIGVWPEAGILGSQLGPNKNGGEPS